MSLRWTRQSGSSSSSRRTCTLKTLLIDADILVFKGAYLNEEHYDFGGDDGEECISTDIEKAKGELDKEVRRLLKATKCRDVVMALTGPHNFRYQVLPTYKSNRKGKAAPTLLQELREYVIATYPSKVKEGIEGDDVMGIMSTLSPGMYIIATIDKDLRQIPGQHYNWSTGVLDEVECEEADLFFYRQILTGDPGDGYRGCHGVGPKKADKILAEAGGLRYSSYKEKLKAYWYAIIEAYEARGGSEADALTQARLARILRKEDYDFKNEVVRLWTPQL